MILQLQCMLAALRSSWTFSELWFWDGNKDMDFQDKRLIISSGPGPRPGGTFASDKIVQIEDAGCPAEEHRHSQPSNRLLQSFSGGLGKSLYGVYCTFQCLK